MSNIALVEALDAAQDHAIFGYNIYLANRPEVHGHRVRYRWPWSEYTHEAVQTAAQVSKIWGRTVQELIRFWDPIANAKFVDWPLLAALGLYGWTDLKPEAELDAAPHDSSVLLDLRLTVDSSGVCYAASRFEFNTYPGRPLNEQAKPLLRSVWDVDELLLRTCERRGITITPNEAMDLLEHAQAR